MSKQDRTNDGFYSKVIIAAVVVIWVSLVGGNWLGHYVVEKGLLQGKEKGKKASDEYRPATLQKPKPWISVDPSQQQELERLQGTTHEETEKLPAASVTPDTPVVTASPVDMETSAPAPEVTPIAEPSAPTPTPADVTFHLQFGSFESRENAQALVDNLQAVGQDSEVEEFKGAGGKDLFRVRGGSFTSEEQARQQRDKLTEQQFKAFIVSQ
ncbi:MAG: SPOR domain-containing protein [Candidatus Eremiobacteraeota bacterium]|nr:SPOR domain-containing protein [Candidatus Eremiobacteraeota bacterium]MCW5867242.1 SPOR domain-containing protein [Candidatus Eremiobacteraeota bacterium]